MDLVPTPFLAANYTARPNVSLQLTTKKEHQSLSLFSVIICARWMSAPYTLWFGLHVLLAYYDAGNWLRNNLSLPFVIKILTVFVCCKYAIFAMVMTDFGHIFFLKPLLKPWLSHHSIIASKGDLVLNKNQNQIWIIVDFTTLKEYIWGLSAITSR